jgi:hypothetical protein
MHANRRFFDAEGRENNNKGGGEGEAENGPGIRAGAGTALDATH